MLNRVGLTALVLGVVLNSHGAWYDNRYFPAFYFPFSRTGQEAFYGDIKGFFMRSDSAYGLGGNEIELYELDGVLDLNQVAEALEKTGHPNPLDPDLTAFKGSSIPFRVPGKVDAQGVRFHFAKFHNYFTVGLAGSIMHVDARQSFKLVKREINGFDELNAADARALEQAFERALGQASEELGVVIGRWDKAGPSDLDLYLGVGNVWNYPRKFRRVDASARVGILIPTGVERDICNAASLPFAGDGHFGAYIEGHVELEMREDMRLGFRANVSNRFSRTKTRRVPVQDEPQSFGALVDGFCVDPRATFVLNPYAIFDDMHNGLGFALGYTFVTRYKDGDRWRDERSDPVVPAKFCNIEQFSAWTAEYISINVFYDFGRSLTQHKRTPILTFVWDAPVRVFGASKLISRTHRISLGVRFDV